MTFGVENAAVFVGREAEWATLQGLLEDVLAGRSRHVFIEGEAGIGKTRLLEELLNAASSRGFSVFAGSAEELEQGRPFAAIADALRRSSEDLPAAAEALEPLLQPGSEKEGAVPPEAVLLDAFVDLVEELAVGGPTMIAVEDLHWADAASIAALRAIGRRLSYLPVLVVGTYRRYPRSQPLTRLLDVASREGAVELRLQPLGERETYHLVRSLIGARPGSRLQTVVKAAGGNPLYVTEIARALSQDGELRVDDEVADVTTTALPPTLRLTILRRISFLPPDTLETLKVSAILGSTFTMDELVTVTGSTAARSIADLRPAIEASILEEAPGRLRFRHDLIQEAIYQDIPLSIRSTMHVDAARALRSAQAPSARIGEHLLRGLDLGVPELFDEAVGLANGLRQASPGLAVALYEKAVELPGVPDERRELARADSIFPLMTVGRIDDAERISRMALERVTDPSVRVFSTWPILEAKMRRGRAKECISPLQSLADQAERDGYYGRIMRTLAVVSHARISAISSVADEAEELYAHAHGDAMKPLPAGVLTSTERARDFAAAATAVALCAVRLAQGRLAEAKPLADEAIEIETREPTPIPVIYTLPAMAEIELDEFDQAMGSCAAGRRRDSAVGDATHPSPYGSLEALVMFLSGAWDAAVVEARTAIDLVADGVGSADLIVGSHLALCQIALRRGDVGRAVEVVEDMERFVGERGPQWGMLAIDWARAAVLEATGNPAGAANVVSDSWGRWPDRYFLTRHTFADFVRLLVDHGDRERAIEITEAAEQGARLAPQVSSVRGAALICRGLANEDADALLAGVESYRKSPRVVELAQACELAGVALARRGTRSDAKALFEEALDFYEGVAATQDARRVTAAMRQAGLRRGAKGKRGRPKSGWDALTEAERQVAMLTVEGLTNPQIAERLYVSKHTVQTHLSHAFAKLGISSRTALAGIAADQQP